MCFVMPATARDDFQAGSELSCPCPQTTYNSSRYYFYCLIYAKWYLSGILQLQNGAWFTSASCPLHPCVLSVMFSYILCSDLLGIFTKSSHFFFNVKSSLRGSKSLKRQEIIPHLIKSSFTPNRIATVSYRLFLICLENTFSDDAK